MASPWRFRKYIWSDSPNLLTTTLRGQDHFYGANGEVPTYDWPNPRIPTQPQENRGFILSSLLVGPLARPFYQVDWPNPLLARQPQENRGFINSVELQLIGKDQFFGSPGQAPVYDYQNPIRPQQPKQADSYSSLLVGPLARPFAQTDWPLPQRLRYPPASDTYPNLLTTTLTITISPFYQTDWPNPQQTKQPLENRGYVHNVAIQLIGKDQFFGAPGQAPTYDWQNPLRPRYPQPTDPTPNLLTTTFTIVVEPFYQTDWPNPLQPRYPQENRGFTHNVSIQLIGKDLFFGAPGQGPVYDYPNPIIPRQPAQAYYQTNLLVGLLSVPFAQTDWPNPIRARYLLQTDAPPNNILVGLLAAPFRQVDWPLPPRPRYPTQPDSYTNLVINVTTAVPFYQTDWPLPQTHRQTQPDTPPNLLTTTFYVVPTQPFHTTDWPLPTRLRYVIQPEIPPDLLTTTLFIVPGGGTVILDMLEMPDIHTDMIEMTDMYTDILSVTITNIDVNDVLDMTSTITDTLNFFSTLNDVDGV